MMRSTLGNLGQVGELCDDFFDASITSADIRRNQMRMTPHPEKELVTPPGHQALSSWVCSDVEVAFGTKGYAVMHVQT